MNIKYANTSKTEGTQTLKNGDKYTGSFHDDKKHGKGTLVSLNGRTYVGEWLNDLPHGHGINTFPNGKTYEGDFIEGKPVGAGLWTYSDGRTYSGVWKNGQFINEDNQKEVPEYRIVTFIINFFVIGFMLSAVTLWVLILFGIVDY
ncbi:MAG: hypothetical protein CMD88_05470 [Gammaproteobacteria bacterium]|nr:hypothetical protein [Gammaproteobacteria bacterium]|tara:strand:+ start:101489 stop:101926 length:438 start_codon:yes stop_codon:yes gene_type:complete